MGLLFRVLCVLCAYSAARPCVAVAQQPAAPAESSPAVLFGVETRRDRFQYHFDNPSSFDTPFLVPHFFEQRYVADNVWALVTLRYTAGVRWETTAGATPQRTATADDYDTFVNPDGTVWVSGTTGDASIRSFRVSQTASIARAGAVGFVLGYRLRVDLADFRLAHKTVTRNGSLVLAEDLASAETTRSLLAESFVGATTSLTLSPRWQLSLSGETSPLAGGRLLVRLPNKYPGEDLVFVAKVATASGRATFARHNVRWPIEVSIDAGRTWSYSPADRLTYERLGAQVAVGRVW